MAVNLDAVFSRLFSTLADDKISTSIRDFDLSIGGIKPAKTIQSHGDWTIAWNATSVAILCTFPHCSMSSNSRLSMCFSFSEPFPFPTTKLLILTRPSTATQGKLNTLSSANLAFPPLEACYLQDDGAGNCSNTSKEKEAIKPDCRSTKACHQWNSGICNRCASECRY